MSDRWVVGRILIKTEAGAVLWAKLGVFKDRALAVSWARYTGADLVMNAEPGVETPPFGELGVSVIQPVEVGE